MLVILFLFQKLNCISELSLNYSSLKVCHSLWLKNINITKCRNLTGDNNNTHWATRTKETHNGSGVSLAAYRHVLHGLCDSLKNWNDFQHTKNLALLPMFTDALKKQKTWPHGALGPAHQPQELNCCCCFQTAHVLSGLVQPPPVLSFLTRFSRCHDLPDSSRHLSFQTLL